ncbi:hypothetical protein [Streptosporangium fragile]|uniref:hypothetical protein n=1 Tax=Streptosporangium fragile TaxID=46186 RepID=UPI0031EB08C0
MKHPPGLRLLSPVPAGLALGGLTGGSPDLDGLVNGDPGLGGTAGSSLALGGLTGGSPDLGSLVNGDPGLGGTAGNRPGCGGSALAGPGFGGSGVLFAGGFAARPVCGIRYRPAPGVLICLGPAPCGALARIRLRGRHHAGEPACRTGLARVPGTVAVVDAPGDLDGLGAGLRTLGGCVPGRVGALRGAVADTGPARDVHIGAGCGVGLDGLGRPGGTVVKDVAGLTVILRAVRGLGVPG